MGPQDSLLSTGKASNQEFRMTVSGKKKLEQVRATGAQFLAASCSNCKSQLTQLMEYPKEVAVGGVHALVSRAIVLNKLN